MSYGSHKVPKEVYGDSIDTFINAMIQEVPSAINYLELTQSLWNSDKTYHSWTLPDNFNVVLPSMVTATETVYVLGEPITVQYEVLGTKKHSKELSANAIHSIDSLIVREMVARCGHGLLHTRVDKELETKLDKLAEKTGFKSARLLYLNPDRKNEFVLPEPSFHIISVHDCFKCNHLYGNELRQTYNQILFELANSDILGSIVSDLTRTKMTFDKTDTEWFSEILDADYSLT